MTKIERGVKRTCPGCDAKFYDLNRKPITCPSCNAVITPDAAPPRRARAAPVVEKVVKEVVEPVAKLAPGIEIVSLDEAAAEEAGKTDEEDLIDLGDDEDIAIEDDDKDVFLEEDDEESDSVSGIVSSPTRVNEEI